MEITECFKTNACLGVESRSLHLHSPVSEIVQTSALGD